MIRPSAIAMEMAWTREHRQRIPLCTEKPPRAAGSFTPIPAKAELAVRYWHCVLQSASAVPHTTEGSTDNRIRQSLCSSTGVLKQSSSLSGPRLVSGALPFTAVDLERPRARESAQDLAPVSVSLPKLVTACSESLEQLSQRTARLALSGIASCKRLLLHTQWLLKHQ